MCEYCDKNTRKKRKFLINNKNLSLIINHDKQIFVLCYEPMSRVIKHEYININYCPMCRRKVR